MLARAMLWGRAAADLGRMYVLSRRPHIEEDLPAHLGPGLWTVIATKRPVQPGEPVYGTPAYKAVEPGRRFWVFVDPGDEYWVYAVQAAETQAALRMFYADPDGATLLDSGVSSAPGFRTELK